MLSVIGLLGLGAGVALGAGGVVVRRAMERGGSLPGIGAMPAGAARDAC